MVFKVLIIGSGLGGLSLAQSLKKSNIAFEIYERDNTPFDRSQGYRLHLDTDAINTIYEVLPPNLISLFNETSQWTEPYTSIMDLSSLKCVKRILTKNDHGDMWKDEERAVHANVDRATLRQILLTGLQDFIHFGRKFERYEITNGAVTAYFADESIATGTVLIGADGINSTVRKQRASNCQTMDAGITAIYGRLPLEAVGDMGPKEALNDIFIIGSDSRKVFLGLGSVIFPTEPSEAASKLAPESKLHERDSYAVSIVGGRHHFFPESTEKATAAELQNIAAEVIGQSSTKAASLVRAGDAESFFVVRLRSSVPSTLSKPTNVTLLGDSIHAMTPSLGRGANLAMRHGALLGRHLEAAAEGRGGLRDELAAYEKHMTAYGFKVVREAAETGMQRMEQSPLPAE